MGGSDSSSATSSLDSVDCFGRKRLGELGVFVEREGEAVDARSRVECGDLLVGRRLKEFNGGFLRAWGQCAKERSEFELGEELAGAFEIGLGGLHDAQVELNGDVAVDGDELFGEQDSGAVLLEGFAIGLALDGVGIVARSRGTASTLPNC